jgi:hypothetical protein
VLKVGIEFVFMNFLCCVYFARSVRGGFRLGDRCFAGIVIWLLQWRFSVWVLEMTYVHTEECDVKNYG